MNKKITIFLIIIMTVSLLGAVSATTPARDHTNSATCYNCNDSSQCYCNDSCLCKDKNYIQKIGGENKIRNNDSCYRCNETCYCPDNCSCKQPYSEDDIEASKEYMNYRNDFFVKTFKNTPVIYLVNYIYINTHNIKHKELLTGPLSWYPTKYIPQNITAGPDEQNSTTSNTTIQNNTTNINNTDNGSTTNLENQSVTTDNNSNDGSNVKDNGGDNGGSGSNGESSGSDNSGGSDSSSSDPGSSSTESSEN